MRTRRGHHPAYGPEVEELRHSLTEWRQSHKAPTRIPPELWRKAAELARRHGIAPVARALRLDYASLRRHTQPERPRETMSPTFMEFVAPSSALVEECRFEVESGRGARMQIKMKNVSPAGIATIVRDFVG